MNFLPVELCFWNHEQDPPTIATVRQALASAGLSPDRAPTIPIATAFRRACDAMRSKSLLVRHFTRKADNAPCVQFDAEINDQERLRRRFMGQYALVDGTLTLVQGEPLADLETVFMRAKVTYTATDISRALQDILATDGLGTYSPKRNGGVYFVPTNPRAPDLLQRIERFASSLSVRFLRYQIPDTPAQRQEIADAIGSSFADEIAGHGAAIGAYLSGTRASIIASRREAIQATDASMVRLRHLMNGRFAECREAMRGLLVRLSGLDRQVSKRFAVGV